MDWLGFPPLSSLRAFSALAETGTAVAAGEKLNVSHAAISQQIKALESRLGLTLVDRSGRSLALTTEGQQLAEALAEGFEGISRTINILTCADADRPLQISTTQLFAVGWLMPRLQSFQERHPDINLLINPTAQVVDMEAGGVDVALRFGAGHWPGLEAELLIPTDVVVAAAPSLIGGKSFEEPKDLVELPWLQELETSDVPDWLRRHEVTHDRLRTIQLPGNLMLEGARRGQGILIASFSNLQADIEAGKLVELFRDAGDTGYFIVTRPGVLRPSAKAFVNWLRRQRKINGKGK